MWILPLICSYVATFILFSLLGKISTDGSLKYFQK